MTTPSPLLEQIRGLQESAESGILTLSRDDSHVNVSYREGMIEAASSNLESHRLGDYLVRGEYLTAQDVPAVLADARRKKILFGEAAVRRKLISPAELTEVVRLQTLELLKHALANDFFMGTFTRSLCSRYAPANINFGHLLLELFRSAATAFECETESLLVRRDDRNFSGLPWYPQELCVLNELQHPITVEALLTSTGLPEPNLLRILGVLDRLGIIETLSDAEKTEPKRLDENMAVIRRSGMAFERLIPLVENAVVSEKLEVLKNATSFISEQFKTLKVRIGERFEVEPKVVTISSPDHQDGKSLISANLALTFSLDPGRRTLIMDCDLRNPSVHKYLGVNIQPGLLQYLSNGNMPPYCYMRRIENLYFLTAGGSAGNPIELLSLRKMSDLIEQLKVDFDTVILDAPPFSPIADARVVSGLSDGMIMVIRRGRTAYSAIERAFRVVDQNKLLGIVFNDVRPVLFNTYYNQDYYHYGRAKGYLSPDDRKSRTSPKTYLES